MNENLVGTLWEIAKLSQFVFNFVRPQKDVYKHTKNMNTAKKHHVFRGVKKITWDATRKHERPKEFTRTRRYSFENVKNLVRKWENVESYSHFSTRVSSVFFASCVREHLISFRPLPKPKINLTIIIQHIQQIDDYWSLPFLFTLFENFLSCFFVMLFFCMSCFLI